jgi:cyclohexanone monooxygenase
MVALSEENGGWIADCIGYVERMGLRAIEADTEAQERWAAELNKMADQSLYPRENSWYVGANVAGKPRMFMSHMDYPKYVESCRGSANEGYSGFTLS